LIKKTEGIVLRTLKHQDANVITTVYTETEGKKGFIVKGYRSARSRSRHSYFQPLSIIEVVYQQKNPNQLGKVSESRLAHLLQTAQTEPVKLSLGLAMMEIFDDTVREEEANPPLYQFFKRVILHLDFSEKRLIHIFLYFLLHHTRFLGFMPLDRSEGSMYCTFDPQTGIFQPSKSDADRVAFILRQFLYHDLTHLPDATSIQQILFSSEEKRHMITTLFKYYEQHVEGFRYPQTMRVFAEIFS